MMLGLWCCSDVYHRLLLWLTAFRTKTLVQFLQSSVPWLLIQHPEIQVYGILRTQLCSWRAITGFTGLQSTVSYPSRLQNCAETGCSNSSRLSAVAQNEATHFLKPCGIVLRCAIMPRLAQKQHATRNNCSDVIWVGWVRGRNSRCALRWHRMELHCR